MEHYTGHKEASIPLLSVETGFRFWLSLMTGCMNESVDLGGICVFFTDLDNSNPSL